MTSSADVAETGLTYKGRTNVLLHLRSRGCSAAGCAAYVNKAALHNQRDCSQRLFSSASVGSTAAGDVQVPDVIRATGIRIQCGRGRRNPMKRTSVSP